MSFITNDNICECGHLKIKHAYDNKFAVKWCELNQKECDCWQYKARYIETREYVDLKIARVSDIIIERF